MEKWSTRDVLRRREVRRVGASILGGFVLGLPLAATHSLTHSQIDDDIATIPSKISFAPGESELQTGLFGTIYGNKRFSQYGVGLSVQVQQPPEGLENLTSSDPRRIVEPFVNYYSDPDAAFSGSRDALLREATHNFYSTEAVVGTAASIAIYGLLTLTKDRTRRRQLVALSPLALLTLGASAGELHEWQAQYAQPTTYKISMLDQTPLEGLETNSATTAQVISAAVPYVETQIERLNQQRSEFDTTARQSIDVALSRGMFYAPSSDQRTVLVMSDLHSNIAMIDVYRYLVQAINETSDSEIITTTLSAGDQTYGSAAEKNAVDKMARITKNFVVINGNHDGDISEKNQRDAGMRVITDPDIISVDDVSVLGASDPSLTRPGSLFGSGGTNVQRHSEEATSQLNTNALQGEVGEKLAQLATSEKIDIIGAIITHEGYSIGPLIDQDFTAKSQFDEWLTSDNPNSPLPASLVAFGHWHPQAARTRIIPGADGINSAVVELGSAGGASTRNSIGSFSTPFTTPVQPASVMLATFDVDDTLMRLQEVVTNQQGSVLFAPTIEVNKTLID